MQPLHLRPPSESTAEVLAAASRFVQRSAATAVQRQLFETALRGLDIWAENRHWTFFIHLPLLVHGAIQGGDRPAVPLATAMTLLYVGMDILDDLADGDEREHWRGYRPAEINLAAVTFLATLTPLAMLELDAPPERLCRLQRTLARMELRMSAGQQADIVQAGTGTVTGSAVTAAAAGKTGTQCALFARLGAELAGAPPTLADTYAEMAHTYGMALQVVEDYVTLFHGERSRDLASGIRTYPIARHLERLTGQERQHFLDLLDHARTDVVAQEQVRRELIDAGIPRLCAVITEVHCQRARRALAAAGPMEPAGSALRALIDAKSWFSSQGGTS